MRIRFNDTWHELPDAGVMTLAAFLDTQTGLSPALATAVNSQFVPRDARRTYVLKDGDHVLGFSPITGG
jgi:thiamine biosynthesis protein ThiS